MTALLEKRLDTSETVGRADGLRSASEGHPVVDLLAAAQSEHANGIRHYARRLRRLTATVSDNVVEVEVDRDIDYFARTALLLFAVNHLGAS